MRPFAITLVAIGCRALSAQSADTVSGREIAPRVHARHVPGPGAAATPRPVLDSAALIADLSALAADSMEGRRIGTPGNARARAYLERSFSRIGVTPLAESVAAPFSAAGRAGATLNGVNLAGFVRGTTHPDRYIAVSAHYDHLGVGRAVNGDSIYNGADDNASGAAGVLALARWFKAHPPENSVIFALFDGEEAGDLGSKAFVERPGVPLDRIIANVNLDMVSRSAKGELFAAGATPWPVMKPLLDSVAAGAAVTLLLGHDSGNGRENWTGQSDQASFHAKRIPWVYFGVEDHPDYHRPSDDVAHIQPGFTFGAMQTIAAFVALLDTSLDRVVAVRAAALRPPPHEQHGGEGDGTGCRRDRDVLDEPRP